MSEWLAVSFLALATLAPPMPAASDVYISAEEQFFRIEWQLVRVDGRPPAIVGSVTNHYSFPVQRVRVQAQIVDDAGQVTHEMLGTIADIPAGGRERFRLQLPTAGARYMMTVHSFEFGAGQSP